MSIVFTSSDLATANKGALRGYCRDYGISSTALNVDGMRAALAEHASDYSGASNAAANVEPVATETATEVATEAATVVEPVAVEPVEPATVETPPAVEPATPRTAAEVFAANPKPAKAAKVRTPREPRDEANGVKRPAAATLCGRIWSWCDAQVAEGVRPEAAALRDALADIDPTTCTVQYYRWRKFNGIRGR